MLDEETMQFEQGYLSFGGYSTSRERPSQELQGEAPPSPKPNSEEIGPPLQLEHEPQGDEVHPIMNVEGQLDKSEDPLKSAAIAQ